MSVEGGISALAFSPNYATDQTLLSIGTGSFNKSTNGGITWTRVSEGPPVGGAVALFLSPSYPTTPVIYTAGSNGTFMSTNDGLTWSRIGEGCNIFAMSPDFANDHLLLCGLNKTTDDGASWTPYTK
jgi:hypothetical protein